ncbi:hypothetical protein Daudx_0467 [Candidatus Desulforudis audaxviator]|nr:hypothetical protein Daudx_0467 [Candidatus Desulforudis audaxviator]
MFLFRGVSVCHPVELRTNTHPSIKVPLNAMFYITPIYCN